MSWVGCLLTDSELFILFAENGKTFLKISVIPIHLNFMNLVKYYSPTVADEKTFVLVFSNSQ